jgi:hypothetical protein
VGTCCSFGGYPLRKRPSPSGGESVTPGFENGQVPLGENQSPQVSKTAKSLWGRISHPEFLRRRISHPEFRQRPSPSGGESVTPSLENGQVPLGENQSPRVPQEENQSPRVSTTAESLRRRISHPESRKRPSPSGGESVTPSFDNGRVPQEENQSPRVSKTAKSIRGRRLISTMSDFHPSRSPAWPPTPMVTSSRKTAKKVRGTIGSPREMRSTSRY